MQHVISFSGGKDSTALLLMMLEKGMPVDRVIFVDTTKEFPQMYKHIRRVEEFIYPLRIEKVKIDYDYWFGEHIKTKGKNKGKKGYGWPDFRNRWCTALKREAFYKQLYNCKHNTKNCGLKIDSNILAVEYHGIAYDEKERCKNNKNRNIKYQLVEWKVTEKQALEYCYRKGFDWDGLYKIFDRVSCFCCPLQRIGELRLLYRRYKDLWKIIEDMDTKSYRKFRSDYTVEELSNRFAAENGI